MELNEKIRKAIKESLPEQMGKELKGLLEQSELNKIKYAKAKEENNEACRKIGELNGQVKELQDILSKHAALEEREKAVSKREIDATVSELTYKLEQAEKRADMVQNFTSGLVRNTIVRESILDGENIYREGYTNENGAWIPPLNKNVNKDYRKDINKE
jgi:16S rRNA C967 or C1407 C5-methylase (RsmB/RsmF family)